MKIGIFGNYLIFEQAGIGKYSQNLVKNLLKIDLKNQYFLYFSFLRLRQQRKKMIEDLFQHRFPPNLTIRIFSLPAAWMEMVLATSLPMTTIIKDPLDVYYSPYVAGIPKIGFAKMTTTIHDLVFLRFPHHRGQRLSNYYLKRHQMATSSCQKIIVPSLATQKDVEKFLKVEPGKIVVIPEAAEERFKPIKNKKKIKKNISRYFNPDFKYILSVGTLEPRKNLAKLVEAYSLLPHKVLKQYRLVLVGGKGWNNKILQKTIINFNLQGKVILTGFARDEDLTYIYNGASVFVYPSLYEGFGLPPLEAISAGIPVICSRAASLREVIGQAGIFVNENNEKEIAQAIIKIISHPKLAHQLSKKGLSQAKNFSWPKTAQETLKLFESL